MSVRSLLSLGVVLSVLAATPASGAPLTFGDQDCLGTDCYGATDPTAGATLEGLAPGVVTLATNSFGHGFPFTPEATDFSPTDQIFVGSVQTGSHDGYSVSPRLNGPQTAVLDFSSLVPAGHVVATLTLGIAADDFQFPVFGQPFAATTNGGAAVALTTQLNALSQTGPVVQFFSIGLDPALVAGGNVLTLSIDQGGDGGDGWAVDFFTVGVTTRPAAVPEPGSLVLVTSGLAGVAMTVWRRRHGAVRGDPAR